MVGCQNAKERSSELSFDIWQGFSERMTFSFVHVKFTFAVVMIFL